MAESSFFHAAVLSRIRKTDSVADGDGVHMVELAYCLHFVPQGRGIGGGIDQLFMQEGREYAIEFSPFRVDGVMSKCFSKDDARVVLVVCIHCQGFLLLLCK